MKRSRMTFGVAFVAALGAASFHGSAHAGAVTYDERAHSVVVSFTEALGEVGEADAGPSLRIYGDGRAVVHYPAFMKRAGDYTVQLSRAEMDALLASLVDNGVLTFSAGKARAAKGAAVASAARSGEVSYSSDPSVISLEIRANAVEQRISWSGVRADARNHPEIAEVQRLSAVVRELYGIMERKDLKRIE